MSKNITFPTHVLETQQFKEPELLERLFSLADEMKLLDTPPGNLNRRTRRRSKELTLPNEPRRRILGNLFYEPSTRTRFSFSRAMSMLGGDRIETESAGQFSSVVKGETLADTVRVISGNVDVLVIRHPEIGAAKQAARSSLVPIINAGDGAGQHPTQALLDLYTINNELGRMDDLKVAMVGDLKYGRTVHSLSYLLAHRDDIKLYFVSPTQLPMDGDIKQYLADKNIPFEETDDVKNVARNVDVLYVTRVQKERFEDESSYDEVSGLYVVGPDTLDLMSMDSRIMHPLPRVNEIQNTIDNDPRCAYFRQSDNGKYLRAALLKMMLDPPNEYRINISRPNSMIA
jgi:aspartate carbamoyltransferase catalytic subunit